MREEFIKFISKNDNIGGIPADQAINDILDFEMKYDCDLIKLDKTYVDEDTWYYEADFEVKDESGKVQGVYSGVEIPYFFYGTVLGDLRGNGYTILEADIKVYHDRMYFSIDELKLLSEYTSFKQHFDTINDRFCYVFTDISEEKVYYRRFEKSENNYEHYSYEFPQKTLGGIKYEPVPEVVARHIDQYIGRDSEKYLLNVQRIRVNEYKIFYAYVNFHTGLYGFKREIFNVGQKEFEETFGSMVDDYLRDRKYNDSTLIGVIDVEKLQEILGF